ncbi:hypothetical protein F4827_001933 [Paraburkholderia bannensis]|uniref:Uncharacterized protein n=1 Tax=Paraburkholderia bannensis TaxID=765414 RepID=A0A7W9TXM7_9BURK|nr:hypothetical protein [Paraburkholderia sp. WP4_3_2]MBB6102085.1 hypothetical protein [Paraburkholderia bannensis]
MASNARNGCCRITRATTRANAPGIDAKCVVATNTRTCAMTTLSRVKTTARCSIHAARITTVDRPDGPRATVTVRGPALRPTALLPHRQKGSSCSLQARLRCSPVRAWRCSSLAQIEIKRRVIPLATTGNRGSGADRRTQACDKIAHSIPHTCAFAAAAASDQVARAGLKHINRATPLQ